MQFFNSAFSNRVNFMNQLSHTNVKVLYNLWEKYTDESELKEFFFELKEFLRELSLYCSHRFWENW